MEKARKITVEAPPELLEKAPRATVGGVTQKAYARLRQLQGKVRFARTSAELKNDR